MLPYMDLLGESRKALCALPCQSLISHIETNSFRLLFVRAIVCGSIVLRTSTKVQCFNHSMFINSSVGTPIQWNTQCFRILDLLFACSFFGYEPLS